MDKTEQLLRSGFEASSKLLIALGDETRQMIISTLMNTSYDAGMRVGEITERTHLSRPAISHHLKILLDADVIGKHPKGTMNFYYMNLGGAWPQFVELVKLIEELRLACKREVGND